MACVLLLAGVGLVNTFADKLCARRKEKLRLMLDQDVDGEWMVDAGDLIPGERQWKEGRLSILINHQDNPAIESWLEKLDSNTEDFLDLKDVLWGSTAEGCITPPPAYHDVVSWKPVTENKQRRGAMVQLKRSMTEPLP